MKTLTVTYVFTIQTQTNIEEIKILLKDQMDYSSIRTVLALNL